MDILVSNYFIFLLSISVVVMRHYGK